MKFAKRRNGRVTLGVHVLGSLTIGMAVSAIPAMAAEQAQVADKKLNILRSMVSTWVITPAKYNRVNLPKTCSILRKL